jgi:hypothetical protein
MADLVQCSVRKIGFSHGVLFKLHDVYTEKNILTLKGCGSNAIEVNCHKTDSVMFLDKILSYVKQFEHVSLHAPCHFRYGSNNETRELLKKLEDFYFKVKSSLVVVHPDLVDDWSVFDHSAMTWAIENMDNRKPNFKDFIDLRMFFDRHPEWSLVLDLGHCYSNDKSMLSAQDMIELFGGRIKEIHLSGYEVFHEPLYRMDNPAKIINYCKKLDVPIIIESVFEKSDGLEGVKKELDCVVKVLCE